MVAATKLGVALLVALASNATLLSVLIKQTFSGADSTTDTTDSTTHTTTDTTTPPVIHDFVDDGAGNSEDGHGVYVNNLKATKLSQELLGGVKETSHETRHQPEPAGEGPNGHRNRQAARPGGVLTASTTTTTTVSYYGTRAGSVRGQGGGWGKGVPPRHQRSPDEGVVDTSHHLEDVIASLTEAELEQMEPSIVKILIPALIGLESVVLRELEGLHDVSVNQELRLEQLEKNRLEEQEVLEAVNVIREEQYLLQRKAQKEALSQQNTATQKTTTPQPSNRPQQDSTTQVVTFEEDGSAENLPVDVKDPASSDQAGDDGSGSGDEPFIVVDPSSSNGGAVTSNYTDSSDNAIINHIYEIYSSITSMEHKVMELGTSVTVLSSELYRQRSNFVRVEDKVGEIRRNQRTLAMKTTMHGFKLSDLEQFKGQAEMMLREAEGAVEQFEAKLEVFKDRVTSHQDEVAAMRNVFGRLEQSSNELRAADAYKAHDIQELKRSNQQLETRLTNLYHSLDRYVGNIRWDVKTYLDHLCASNDLQC